jgi:hypothetical protein
MFKHPSQTRPAPTCPGTQSDRRGATAVEFAIVLPVLLIFVFGLFELYSVYRVHSEAVTALAQGSREASILTSTNTDIESAIRNNLKIFGICDPDIVVEPLDINSTTPEIDISVTIQPGIANGLFVYRYFGGNIVKSITYRRL